VAATRVTFERGTLRVDGPDAGALAFVRFDDRTGYHRAAAHTYGRLRDHWAATGIQLEDRVAPAAQEGPRARPAPSLRPYQAQALAAFEAFGRRGILALPTGSGKTRVACAAVAHAGCSALVLVPTCALLDQWASVLRGQYGTPIGVVGDGEKRIEPLTVMTFESAYRGLDLHGHRFGMLIVDEIHHFASGLRAEALEMCTAPARLGLTATPPTPGSAGDVRLRELVGPIVFELEIADLVGRDLAALDLVRVHVSLTHAERVAYERDMTPFQTLRREILTHNREADWATCIRSIARTSDGPQIISRMHRAAALAAFPAAKRSVAQQLLARHRADRTLLFTATAEHAFTLGADALIPVITADVPRGEREAILAWFREGRVRAVCSARVLNEGVDVPDANVAVLVGGALGAREYVQRLGRILRPRDGKRATAYELTTLDTVDEARTRARGRGLVARRSAFHHRTEP
jgi:superfamily II DNA or RNA helicase